MVHADDDREDIRSGHLTDEKLADIAKQLGFDSVEAMREAAVDSIESLKALQSTFVSGADGVARCPSCFSDAIWTRLGQDWDINCECGYAACGQIPVSQLGSARH